jgi:hypothetical protein
MSIAATWPQCLAFFGPPLVIEPSPGQLSGDAGRLSLRLFDLRRGHTQALIDALDGHRDPDPTKEHLLEEIARVSSDADKTRHERYLGVFQLLQRRDSDLADTFDDLRRSTDMRQLALIQSHELLSEEEFDRFSS